MRKTTTTRRGLVGAGTALTFLFALPAVSASADTEPEESAEVTASEVEMATVEVDEELVAEDGEVFVPPTEENPLLPDELEEYAAARTDLNSEVAIIGVTWDSNEMDAPSSVQLRSQHGDDWTEWADLEIPDEAETGESEGIVGTDEYLVVDGDKVEVIAIGEDGQAIDGVTLNVIDPLGAAEVDNQLDTIQTGELEDAQSGLEDPQSGVEDSQSGMDEEEQPQEDVLLDLDGASEVGDAQIKGFIGELGTASATQAKFSTGYLGLNINTRADWGADESYRKGFVDINVKYRGAVVHHTAGNNNYTKAQVPSVIRGIYYYHAKTLDWGDIGYQFLVDKYGGVWEGRYKTLSNSTPRGAQAYGANNDTFGISVIGDYTYSAPPAVAQDAVAKTIAWKLNKHGITNIDGTIKVPGYYGNGINLPIVSAHRDVGATSCPGDAFYARMPQIRTKVKSYMAEYSKNTPKDPPATETPKQPTVGAWDYGNIISDEVFYNGTAMTATQIQTFLNKEGASCKASGSKTCLKDTKFPTKKLTTLRGACKPLNLTGNQSAAKIIAETGKACDLNPQVILANLQKESSGIYQPLTATGWAKVTGSACPDGKPCDPKQAGFAQQIYYGADKLASYRLDTSWPYIAAVKSGKKVTIPHKYNQSSCGSASFVIKNNATASLYTYTPFAPNAATIKTPSAGGACSSPGWVIFRNYMIQWFPDSMKGSSSSTTPSKPTTPTVQSKVPTPKLKGTVRFGNKVSVTGVTKTSWTPEATSVTYQWLRSGTTIKGATKSTYTPGQADIGKKLSVRVTGKSGSKIIGNATSASKTVAGPKVTRVSASGTYSRSTAVNKVTAKTGKPLFIVSGQKYAHGLTVAPAVSSVNGSMLLVSSKGPTSAQLAHIRSIRPNTVYIVGSKAVLPTSVFNKVKTATGKTPVRVTGTGRSTTSHAIFNRFFANKGGDTVFVVTGKNYSSALAASAVAGASKSPVIVLDGKAGNGFTPSIKSGLLATGRKNVVLVGGTGSITTPTRRAIEAQGFNATRITGSNRYVLNANLNKWLDKKQPRTAVHTLWVAPGFGFASGLAAAAPAAAPGQRLVLSKASCIPGGTVASLKQNDSLVTNIRLVGPASNLNVGIAKLPACG